MENIYFNIRPDHGSVIANEDPFKLLAAASNMEVMRQSIKSGSPVWVTPSEEPDVMEFFFVISGSLSIDANNETFLIKPGDSFFVNGLKDEVALKALSDTELLYVTNSHVYNSLSYFQSELTELLMKINEKDDVTYAHSKNVVRYSVKLLERLAGSCAQAKMDKLVTSALFHDIGKCYVPDEILKKTGSLTPDEFKYIAKHPLDTRHMLRTRFGNEVAEIAACHHERIDGSGYPYGLKGSEMSMESKILAVADAFDAMTANRGYNNPKGYVEAAKELYSLDNKFDRSVTSALLDLSQEGAFNQ